MAGLFSSRTLGLGGVILKNCPCGDRDVQRVDRVKGMSVVKVVGD